MTLAVTGGTGEFAKARGQMHETFLPTGEFRFAFTPHREAGRTIPRLPDMGRLEPGS